MKETEDIELKSEEIHEILSRPPHNLIRWGISVICGILLLILIGSFFFVYPDIVQGQITITTENPPAWIVAKSTGKIKELYCSDKQPVKEGELLAVIDNPALTTDVHQLKLFLSTVIISDSILFIPETFSHKNYELGNIQPAYSSFTKTLTDYQNFISLNLINQEKNALQVKISGYKIYSSGLEKQLKLKQNEVEISRKIYEREKSLHTKGTISKAELDIAEQSYLSAQQTLTQLETSTISNQIEFKQLGESVSKLSIQYSQEKNNLLSNLKSAYSELLYTIESWEQTYLLITPSSGIITFNDFWTQNQFVNSGEKIFAVIPHNSGKLIGKIKIPVPSSGKVKIGQPINVKIEGFPYMEYGMLRGKITNISMISNEDYYSAESEFPSGLKTSAQQELHFTGELTGTADIITEDKSIAWRILSPLKHLLDTHTKKENSILSQ